MAFAAPWMDLETVILSEVSQRRRSIIWHHLYVESKVWHEWTYLQNRTRVINGGNKLTITEGKVGDKSGDYDWRTHITIFSGGSVVKNLPAMQDTQVWSLGWEDPLEKGKGVAAHSSIFAWEIPWTRGAWRAIVHGTRKLNYWAHMHV